MFYCPLRKRWWFYSQSRPFLPSPILFIICVAVLIPLNQREAHAADYWRSHCKELLLALGADAQTVYGCPVSAGVMGRDFCIADMFMLRNRG